MKTASGRTVEPRFVSVTAARFRLRGRVQGFGVRPAIANLAVSLGLRGFVTNDTAGVEVLVEGEATALSRFHAQLLESLPPAAVVEECCREELEPSGARQFEIVEQRNTLRLSTPVPLDLAVCDSCLRESMTSNNRRAGYAFTSCTQCGPRYSIIGSMPYERSRTSMAEFELCPTCQQEYESRTDRRFHAQTNACPECGPAVWLCDGSQRNVVRVETSEPIAAAAKTIAAGGILALRGIGGYQLIVDAGSESAVRRLRVRKGRPSKPLAVMVANEQELNALAAVNESERSAFNSSENPIVIVLTAVQNGGAWRSNLVALGL